MHIPTQGVVPHPLSTFGYRLSLAPPPPCSNQPTFDLDPAALEKRYKLLQWQLHPDKTVTRSPEEQQFSAEQATRVNQAYGVLRRPLSRANYMVSQYIANCSDSLWLGAPPVVCKQQAAVALACWHSMWTCIGPVEQHPTRLAACHDVQQVASAASHVAVAITWLAQHACTCTA